MAETLAKLLFGNGRLQPSTACEGVERWLGAAELPERTGILLGPEITKTSEWWLVGFRLESTSVREPGTVVSRLELIKRCGFGVG